MIFTLKTDFAGMWGHLHRRMRKCRRISAHSKGQSVFRGRTGEHDMPVSVESRGNTSQSESQCPFPKMILGFKKDPATDERVSRGTLFDGLASVGLGMHCGGKLKTQIEALRQLDLIDNILQNHRQIGIDPIWPQSTCLDHGRGCGYGRAISRMNSSNWSAGNGRLYR